MGHVSDGPYIQGRLSADHLRRKRVNLLFLEIFVELGFQVALPLVQLLDLLLAEFKYFLHVLDFDFI